MLSIPNDVKALFSSDTVHKNFHVTFPDGEYTDLNNENVISESVQFTESLCSQQYFKFGLAEASQLEFTAVGIPNVRGAYIEAAIEIDCTRLGAAWAAANPVDSSLPFLTPQTCNYDGKLYYRVPYGRFKVDTCPRDHGAMWQRQITAFSVGLAKSDMINRFSSWKDSLFGKSKFYSPKVKLLLFATVYENKQDDLISAGFTKTVPNIVQTADNPVVSWTIEDKNGNRLFELFLTCKTIGFTDAYLQVDTKNSLVGFNQKNYDDANRIMIGNIIDYFGVTPADFDLSTRAEVIEYILAMLNEQSKYFDCVGSYSGKIAEFFGIEGNNLLYPERDIAAADYSVDYSFYIYTGMRGYKTSTVYTAETLDPSDVNSIAVYTQTGSTDIDNLTVKLNSTLNTTISRAKYWSFANAYSMYDMMVGFMELCGWFLKPERDGGLQFFQISENPTAIPVSASDWSEFWWDETPIDAIGQVNVIYTVDNEEQQETFVIGDGNSVYTIEDNEVLKAAELDMSKMQDILDDYFAPNANVVNFTPVDLEMRGLPYLESGDYIELTAEDGTTVQTYILNQTISGIQHLTASVTSTNGELLEVIDDE